MKSSYEVMNICIASPIRIEVNGLSTDLLPNPYAPPVSSRPSSEAQFDDGLAWRKGRAMLLKSGAALPARCFTSGQPACHTYELNYQLKPVWLYLALIAGVIPYFLLAPFATKKVRLQVPLAKAIYESHRKLVRRGLVLMFISCGLSIAGIVGLGWSGSLSLLMPLGIILGLTGLFLASRSPVSLSIAKFNEDVLILFGVHPRCLAELPEAELTDVQSNS